VAASSPRNDQRVSAAAAETAENPDPPVRLNGMKCPASIQKIPRRATARSGISLRTVVATCTHPAARIPRQLTQVRIQTAAAAAAHARKVLLSSTGTKIRR
jgi:hypothetical protein